MNNKISVPMAVEEVVAREAIGKRMNELWDSAARSDWRPWIKDRPLTSCLLAAGAGVALGILASYKPGQTETDPNHTQGCCKGHRTLGAIVAASLFSTFKPKIRDLIHTAMGGLTEGADKAADG